MKRAVYGFLKLFGVAVDDSDDVYVTDYERRCVFKIDRKFVNIKDVKPSMSRFSPRGIAVFDNQVIVADSMSNQLVFFSRDLDFIQAIDSHASKPVGVACDQDGNIYVCDSGGDRIQVLSPKGEQLYSFCDKSIDLGSLREPHSICIDSSELLYISEWRPNHCVSVFTKEGKFLALLILVAEEVMMASLNFHVVWPLTVMVFCVFVTRRIVVCSFFEMLLVIIMFSNSL